MTIGSLEPIHWILHQEREKNHLLGSISLSLCSDWWRFAFLHAHLFMPLEVEPLDDPSTEKGRLAGLDSPLVGDAANGGEAGMFF